jgi:hypothetical protein
LHSPDGEKRGGADAASSLAPLKMQNVNVKEGKMISIEQELVSILNSKKGEREIHDFLKNHTTLIEMAFNRAWNFHVCIPEFQLGAEFRSDFLILSAHSGHWHAIFIELKDFKSTLYNKNGNPSPSLQQAKNQINEWKEWKRVNEAYLRKRFARILEKEKAPAIWPHAIECVSKGYSSGAKEISDLASRVTYYYHIVIGRSSSFTPEERRLRERDSTWGGPEIATYDRLLTMAKRVDDAERFRIEEEYYI